MSDFKKLFKVTWKRFGLWIVLLSLFVAMISSFSVRTQTKNDAINISKAVEAMAKDVNMPIDTSKIDQEFLDEADKIATAYVEKYNIKPIEFYDFANETEYERYYKEMKKKYKRDYWEIVEPTDIYAYLRNRLTSSPFEAYDVDIVTDTYPDSYAVDYVRQTLAPLLFFICMIAMLITSLEQSLPYYEFTMMYPWKKRDEVWMKSILVFVFGLIIIAINLVIGLLVLKSSALGPAITFDGVGSQLLNNILIGLATSILSVATGMISGNFVGHLGLMLIATWAFDLVRYIIYILISVFSDNMSLKFNMAVDNFNLNLPGFFEPFFTVFNTTNELPNILGYIVVALIWGLIAYAINKNISAEKSGYLIVSKPMEIVAKVLGILSLTSLLFIMLNTALTGSEMIFLNVIAYALSLLISYKLFDILFKVRLKF